VVALFTLGSVAFGWAPPIALLRALRFRTAHEISFERAELTKALAT
jgi:hypothetical protein